jgi:hypothetical protein
MNVDTERLTEAQTWHIRLKPAGFNLLSGIVDGQPFDAGWFFVVQLPQDDKRDSQTALVEEVRRLGALQIANDYRRYGVELSDAAALQLANHECLEGTRQ